MRNQFNYQLKYLTLFGTLNERRVANAVLYFYENRAEKEIREEDNLPITGLPNNKFMNDYTTKEGRMYKSLNQVLHEEKIKILKDIRLYQFLTIYAFIVVGAFIIGLLGF